MASPSETLRVPRGDPPDDGEAVRPLARGEAELDADTDWDLEADDDGDWSGCAHDGDHEEG